MLDNTGSTAAAAALLIFGFFLFIVAIAAYVIGSFFLMKVFEKAGVEGKWRAWVPVYNFMVFAKLGDVSPWAMLIAIGAAAVLNQVPVIGGIVALLPLAVSAIAAWRVGLKLQKQTPWVVLYVFLALVWLGINAFDRSRWNPVVGPAPWAGNSLLADSTVWAGVPVQPQPAPGSVPPAGSAPAPGYTPPAPPVGHAPPAPPAGYTPPPAPPAGTTPPAPPVGYEPPPAPPAGATPPAPPTGVTPPPAGDEPPPAPTGDPKL